MYALCVHLRVGQVPTNLKRCFGRSDHVEVLSQLGPLRSRKGISQLGIPKGYENQSSLGLGHTYARCEQLCIRPGDTFDQPPFNGSTGGTLRAHPRLARGQTHL